MKRTIKFLFVIFALCLALSTFAFAKDEVNYDELDDLECLVRGVIRTTPEMTLEEFYETMRLIDESDNHINSDKFMYFCQVIEAYYYESIDRDEVFRRFAEENPYVDTSDMDAVYTALFGVLDKYSYYLNSGNSEHFWNPTSNMGIGVTLVYDETGKAYGSVGTFIEGVSPGSSAEEAGILRGDKIVSLMGISVENLPFGAVSSILSACANEENIHLVYERVSEEGSETNECVIERRTTVFREVSFHLYPEKNAFMVDIDTFSNVDTGNELIERMGELRDLGYTSVIVDLRDNGGGDVQVAANVIGAFLEEEVCLFTMGREGVKDYYSFYSTGDGVEFDNIYVLVNENTASSAEITAYCLQKLAGAELVGTKTVGKGVAQTAGRIIDGSTFAVTTFVAYDRDGRTYNEKGLMPRYYIENETEKFNFPQTLEWFNHTNYVEAVFGAENEVVVALERRLEIMGYLRSESVDGVWDENTTYAVMVLQYAVGEEVTGELTHNLVTLVTDIINHYKTLTTLNDRQMEAVLQMIY